MSSSGETARSSRVMMCPKQPVTACHMDAANVSEVYWAKGKLDYGQKITGLFFDGGRPRKSRPHAQLPSLMHFRSLPMTDEREVILVDFKQDWELQRFQVGCCVWLAGCV